MNRLLSDYRTWLKQAQARGASLTRFKCPNCDALIYTIKPSNEYGPTDKFATCPYCQGHFMEIVYPDGRVEARYPTDGLADKAAELGDRTMTCDMVMQQLTEAMNAHLDEEYFGTLDEARHLARLQFCYLRLVRLLRIWCEHRPMTKAGLDLIERRVDDIERRQARLQRDIPSNARKERLQ